MESSPKKFKIAFCGTPAFVVPVLETLFLMDAVDLSAIITQADKPGYRNKIFSPATAVWANTKKIRLFQPTSLKDQQFGEEVTSLDLDAVIVFAYGLLIPQSVLALPKMGWLNIHPSLLPEYRGASPIQSAILEGRNSTGVSFMLLDKGMDTGPIIAQQSIAIEAEDSTISLREKMVVLACDMIQKTLVPYLLGDITPRQQDSSKATITKQFSKEDGHVSWLVDADRIIQMTKALTPWPGTWSHSKIGKLQILKAEQGPKTNEAPGTIFIKNKSFYIACKDGGSIRVLQIQREGKKPTDGESFLRGASQLIQSVLD